MALHINGSDLRVTSIISTAICINNNAIPSF